MLSTLIINTVIIMIILQYTQEFSHFNPQRRPKLMGDIIPLRGLSTHRRKIQQKIVLYHNFFRTRVDPPAANMLRMKWHKGAARAAQKWSDECMLLTHDNETGRYIREYGACGQNIFIASHRVPWLFAIKSWWLEKNDFEFGKKNNISIIGHYTQMVWASTHEVGCGISKCNRYGNVTGRVYYNYVCNYCPIGNHPRRLNRPYKKGNPCESCPRKCHHEKLCTNVCPYANLWANCKQLYKFNSRWLCNTQTKRGHERVKNCSATCLCKGKIRD